MDPPKIVFSSRGSSTLRRYALEIPKRRRQFSFLIPQSMSGWDINVEFTSTMKDREVPVGLIQHSLKHAVNIDFIFNDTRLMDEFRSVFYGLEKFVTVTYANRNYRIGRLTTFKTFAPEYYSLVLTTAYLFHMYIDEPVIYDIMKASAIEKVFLLAKSMIRNRKILESHRNIMYAYIKTLAYRYYREGLQLYSDSKFDSINLNKFREFTTLKLSKKRYLRYSSKDTRNVAIYDMDRNVLLLFRNGNVIITMFQPTISPQQSEKQFFDEQLGIHAKTKEFLTTSNRVTLPKNAEEFELLRNRFINMMKYIDFAYRRESVGADTKEMVKQVTQFALFANRICSQCFQPAKFKLDTIPHKIYCSEQCYQRTL